MYKSRYNKFDYRKRRRSTNWRLRRTVRKFAAIGFVLLIAGMFQLDQNGSWLKNLDIAKSVKPARSSTGGSILGSASVIDGDTIRIRGQKVRLFGIDAPETRQTCTGRSGVNIRCGSQSTRYLKRLVRRGGPIKCTIITTDRYNRIVGDCYRKDGINLAVAMVEAGHALDWPKYSGRAYSSAQRRAKAGKKGLWAYRFEMPWDYRSRKRAG